MTFMELFAFCSVIIDLLILVVSIIDLMNKKK